MNRTTGTKPTNERPELPNSAAFGGRLFFVPFLADYSDRSKQDPELETTLAREAPGILAQLIQRCPGAVQQWVTGSAGSGLTVRSARGDTQVEKILTELKAKYQDRYKRLRREGKNGPRVFYFLGTAVQHQEE